MDYCTRLYQDNRTAIPIWHSRTAPITGTGATITFPFPQMCHPRTTTPPWFYSPLMLLVLFTPPWFYSSPRERIASSYVGGFSTMRTGVSVAWTTPLVMVKTSLGSCRASKIAIPSCRVNRITWSRGEPDVEEGIRRELHSARRDEVRTALWSHVRVVVVDPPYRVTPLAWE